MWRPESPVPVGVDVVQRKAASGFLIVGMAGIQERKMLTKFIIYVLKIESISTFFLTTFFLTKLIWGFFFFHLGSSCLFTAC